MVHQDCLDHTIPRTKKLCNLTICYTERKICVQSTYCMHSMGCVNKCGYGLNHTQTVCSNWDYIAQLCVLNVFFIQHQDWHHFFDSSLLGFRAFKVFVFCTITHYDLWGKMCSNFRTGRNSARTGNFQSLQMQSGEILH